MVKEARVVEKGVLIIDGWGKEESESGHHTTNYREVNVTNTYNYSPVPLNQYVGYSPFDSRIGTVVNNYTINYGTSGRREE